jgi:hypothetical protein
VVVGDGGHEVYTAIVWGVGMSHEICDNVGPEAVHEGNMCGTATRGADALPGSMATSRTKGARRNLGDLVSPAIAKAVPGHGRKPRRRDCIVPGKRRTMLSGQQRRRLWRKAVDRREGERQRMSRTQRRIRHVTEAASLRIGAGLGCQAPNADCV